MMGCSCEQGHSRTRTGGCGGARPPRLPPRGRPAAAATAAIQPAPCACACGMQDEAEGTGQPGRQSWSAGNAEEEEEEEGAGKDEGETPGAARELRTGDEACACGSASE